MSKTVSNRSPALMEKTFFIGLINLFVFKFLHGNPNKKLHRLVHKMKMTFFLSKMKSKTKKIMKTKREWELYFKN